VRPYARLVRLPAVPTALADVALAGLATGALPARWPAFLLLLAASACLYMAGMALNDYFDVEEDRRDRPGRPIPSGQVSLRQAGWFAAGLLAAGFLFAAVAGAVIGAGLPALLAGLLAGAILLYDGWLKPTVLAPAAMGLCRFLNVLLGVSLAGSLEPPLGPHLALVVGVYIAGVTWFARHEAGTSRRVELLAAAALMGVALLLALPLPAYRPPDTASPLFPYLLVALGFLLAFPVRQAILTPTPAHVQAAVHRCLLGLILLDTVLATATAGTVGLVLLVLLAPSLYLSRKRWLYAT
jgi:4-hydroxybenzoate polyprenyltransferase